MKIILDLLRPCGTFKPGNVVPIFKPGDVVVWESISGHKIYYKINKIENGCYYFNDIKKNIGIENIVRIDTFENSLGIFKESRLITDEEKLELL